MKPTVIESQYRNEKEIVPVGKNLRTKTILLHSWAYGFATILRLENLEFKSTIEWRIHIT